MRMGKYHEVLYNEEGVEGEPQTARLTARKALPLIAEQHLSAPRTLHSVLHCCQH